MREAELRLTKGELRYLVVVYELGKGGELVKASEVACRLNVKSPSAVEALEKLSKLGLVIYFKRKGVKITKRGMEEVLRYYRRHRILETLLVTHLNMDLDEACREARNIDAYVSDDLINRVCKLLGHPRKCPHGYDIPPSSECCGTALVSEEEVTTIAAERSREVNDERPCKPSGSPDNTYTPP